MHKVDPRKDAHSNLLSKKETSNLYKIQCEWPHGEAGAECRWGAQWGSPWLLCLGPCFPLPPCQGLSSHPGSPLLLSLQFTT